MLVDTDAHAIYLITRANHDTALSILQQIKQLTSVMHYSTIVSGTASEAGTYSAGNK